MIQWISSNSEVALIDNAIASISRWTRRSALRSIPCSFLAIRGKLLRDIYFATFVLIHHVAAIKRIISQFESLAAATSIKSILVFSGYFILRMFVWGMGTRQCVDMWGKNFVVCMTLFAIKMVLLGCKVLLLLPCFDAVQADTRSGKSWDWRLEVALTALRLAHLMLAELSVIIQFKFVLVCPEAVT